MTQAVVLNYVSLDHMYLTTVSSVDTVWVIYAYINENSTHRSETKIQTPVYKFYFLSFYTIFHTKNVLTTIYRVWGRNR